jgi:hypothetical protein
MGKVRLYVGLLFVLKLINPFSAVVSLCFLRLFFFSDAPVDSLPGGFGVGVGRDS